MLLYGERIDLELRLERHVVVFYDTPLWFYSVVLRGTVYNVLMGETFEKVDSTLMVYYGLA